MCILCSLVFFSHEVSPKMQCVHPSISIVEFYVELASVSDGISVVCLLFFFLISSTYVFTFQPERFHGISENPVLRLFRLSAFPLYRHTTRGMLFPNGSASRLTISFNDSFYLLDNLPWYNPLKVVYRSSLTSNCNSTLEF